MNENEEQNEAREKNSIPSHSLLHALRHATYTHSLDS